MGILSSGGSFILCLLPLELLDFLNSIRNASSPIPFFPKMARTLVEYLILDHAKVISPTQIANFPHFYQPVHGVFKDSSTTTKLRPVFDASAKSSTGVSLNDILDPGPCLYPALADVLIRFRTHNIGVAADISKMFREVLLHSDDGDLHRFLLRDEHGNIQDLV